LDSNALIDDLYNFVQISNNSKETVGKSPDELLKEDDHKD